MQKIKLNYPVEVNSQTYKEINLRRSKVKDRLAVGKMKNASDEEKEIRFFANLCEVAPEVIEELDESDYKEISDTYMRFFKREGTSDAPSLFSQE
ncbi:MAG: phage tail assembly protein [Alphaproteobacteria bacterium]